MFRVSYRMLGFTILLPLSFLPAKTYIWTDVNGQKIEASYVRSAEDSVTISIDGQELDLPLDSLSAFSKALALKLKAESGSTAKPASQKKLYPWKDLQGRVIEAEFLEATNSTVKLLWNGQPFELSLATLSQESKNLARKLSGGSPANNSNAQQASPAPKTEQPRATDPDGPLDLNAQQIWLSADERTLRAKFIDFSDDELSLLTGSEQEVQIHVDNLSSQAVSLAKKLKALLENKKKKADSFAKARKKMKVPEVSVQDLDKLHKLKNSDGVEISATFVDADDYTVSISLAGRSNTIELPWDKFGADSQALIEALRRKSIQSNRKPSIIAAKGGKIAHFASGQFKNYNSVIRTERFDVGLGMSGTSIKIWLKNVKNPNVTPKIFGVYFSSEYTDKTNPERWRKRQRSIVGYDSPPEPSMSRENTTLVGKFNHGGTFQYDIELNSKGLLFWGKIKDPPGEEWPTRLSIRVSVPGFVPDSKNKSMQEVMKFVGDGTLLMQPESGKSRVYPYKEKWATMSNKYKGQKFGSLKSATVMGFPYGNNKMTIIPTNRSGMYFSRHVAYGRVFPFQGFAFEYGGIDKKKEIPKNKSLKILLTGL